MDTTYTSLQRIRHLICLLGTMSLPPSGFPLPDMEIHVLVDCDVSVAYIDSVGDH